MDFFTPKLFDNRPIKFPIQFYGYGYNFVYPLSSKASWSQHFLKNLGFTLSCTFYITTLFHEFTWMYENTSNIPGMVDCLATVLAGGQFLVRLIICIFKKKAFKNILKRFYAEIYYDEIFNADKLEFLKPLRVHEHFIDYFTKFYLSPGIFFIINFTVDGLHYNLWEDKNKPYIYQMSFHFYDAQQPFAYVVTAFSSSWLAWSVVNMMMMGDFFLCTVLLHLTYRYKELRRRTENLFISAQKNSKNDYEMQKKFRENLYDIFQKQRELQRYDNL